MTRVGGPQTHSSMVQPRTGRTDTVRSGDTMTRIAARHNVSLQQLVDANPQISDPNTIRVGQSINIPDTATVRAAEPVQEQATVNHSAQFAAAPPQQSMAAPRSGVNRSLGNGSKPVSSMTVKKRDVDRNWNLGVGHKDLNLSDVQDVSQRDSLRQADANKDGILERAEVWNHLDTRLDTTGKAGDKSATIEQTASNEEFREALSSLYTQRSGRAVKAFEKTDVQGDVLYLQFNRNKGQTREEKDVARAVSKDQDKPDLTRLDITKDFNDWPSARTDKTGHDAFKAHIRDYVKNIQQDGKSMSGFVLSGHSDGQFLLEELPDHTYEKKVDVRKALLELKNEDPEIAKAFDQVEYVALQACFQGEAMGEWGQIFPNATIAGTQQFAPAASSSKSGRLLKAAIQAGTASEQGESMEKAMAKGEKELAKVAARRQPLVDTPEGRLDRARVRLQEARDGFAKVEGDIEKFSNDFNGIVQNLPPGISGNEAWDIIGEELMNKGYSSSGLKTLYAATNRLVLAERGMTAMEGGDPNNFKIKTPGGRDVDSPNMERMRDLIFNSRFVTH